MMLFLVQFLAAVGQGLVLIPGLVAGEECLDVALRRRKSG